MSKTLNEVRLTDLLPPNLKNDPKTRALSDAIYAGLISAIESIEIVHISTEKATNELLDSLAWQNHVDFYDATLPIEVKRELINNSFKWHLMKGTPAAVEELISAVFGGGVVQEWWEYGGQPYHFKVITDNTDATGAQAYEFMRALNSVKRLSAWLDDVVVETAYNTNFYIAQVVQEQITQTLTIGVA